MKTHENDNVFPTHVGMDRIAKGHPRQSIRIPHTRGDGPLAEA